MNNLRLAFHAELEPEQRKQAALIYVDERNWGPVIKADFNCQGYYPSTLEEMAELIVADAIVRDALFPQGQIVLLGKEESGKEELGNFERGEWKVLGSIHTLLSNDIFVRETFQQPDTWNVFTDDRRPDREKYDPNGNRWVCYAVQTDQSLDREKWKIKPADLIIKGVRAIAFGMEREIEALKKEIGFSSEFQHYLGNYSVKHINPLTRLSGFAAFQQKYPEITAVDYARNLEMMALQRKSSPGRSSLQNKFDLDLEEISKRCSLRYHLSRGARLEQVIERFRIHDAASLGYGASVLYLR